MSPLRLPPVLRGRLTLLRLLSLSSALAVGTEEASGQISLAFALSLLALSSGHGPGRGTSPDSTAPQHAARRRPRKARGILPLQRLHRVLNGPRTHPTVHAIEQGMI